jgi:hypothetical protein
VLVMVGVDVEGFGVVFVYFSLATALARVSSRDASRHQQQAVTPPPSAASGHRPTL